MKYIYITYIYIKRHLKSGFILALLIMPLLTCGISYFIPQENISLRAGVYSQGNDAMTQALVGELLSHEGYVSFVQVNSRQELVTGVQNKSLECGYIIPKDIEDKINTLELKGAIVRGENPSSAFSQITDEIVFAKLMKVCGYSPALDFAKKNNLSLNSNNIINLYNNYINGEEVFSLTFEKITSDNGYSIANTNVDYVVTGLMSVYIMLGGLFGVLSQYKDEKNGVYLWGMGNIVATTGLMCVFAIVSMVIGGFDNIAKHIALMIIYFVSVCSYSMVLKKLFKSSNILCGAIPIITIGAICFCPIVFDIGSLYPAVGFLGRLFPTYYYVSYLRGNSVNAMVVFTGVCIIICLVLDAGKNIINKLILRRKI